MTLSLGRLFQICPRYPPDIGGIERRVEAVAERLAARGWDITVATTSPGSPRHTSEKRNGVRIERFPALAPGSAYYASNQLRSYIATLSEADIVHAHGVHAFPAYYGLSDAIPPRVLTPHFHGSGHTFFRKMLFRPYRTLLARRIQDASWIVFVSKTEERLFRWFFPESSRIPSLIIPNGVDIEAIRTAPTQDLGSYAILVCGRLERYKHVDSVIRALRWLPAAYHVCVVGSGPAESELRKLASRIAPERVTFRAKVSEQALYGMYKGARAYVNLSEKEAFGITLLEAFAAGTPCVVLDSMGLSEVASEFPKCAKLVRSLDPRDVATAVLATGTYSPPDLRAYEWSRIATSHDELYKRIIRERPMPA